MGARLGHGSLAGNLRRLSPVAPGRLESLCAHPLPPPMSCADATPKARRVLLILDAQVGLLAPPPAGVPRSPIVKSNLTRILLSARAASHPPLIVHVRNCGDAGEVDERGTPGWELVHAPLAHEPVIDKLKNNAFAGTRLGELVSAEARLVVVGLQSDFCVRATCSAALGRGNDVLLIKGAHATYDRLEVWLGGGVTAASAVEREVEAELEEAGVILLDMNDVPGVFAD
ncbi:Isochorismatase hydrolase [Artomyces pyxidatus]|uniref:Isochorismatase hydrolase n=1 Tax=Artomyces pyxidatus TaxID=48021 RepID=A0ACB8SRH9_9AGAM|nr:Isochorismatase hydrolase [Artomyces pyxidatus]